MKNKPTVVGVGYALQHIETIEPQQHDIPMDVIVTEQATHRYR
jgi:5-formyltetrahydrofolate cyclo-ligase